MSAPKFSLQLKFDYRGGDKPPREPFWRRLILLVMAAAGAAIYAVGRHWPF